MSAKQEEFRRNLVGLGFDEVRFAGAAKAPEEARAHFSRWLDDGFQADMAWMGRSAEKRMDPELVLQGARSAVLFGVNYLPPPESGVAGCQKRWAKYALYHDYHDTIKKGLEAASRLLEESFGLARDDYRYYVDTGPVMERGLAVRSGLGWQGKNGMLISRSHGNWLFLAAILTRFPFHPDPPLLEDAAISRRPSLAGLHCGSCVRCIEACPTGAIVRPGMVDARRCISFQTIENKGVIPREFREGIGGRVYGCDICLDVCPWNRFARAGRGLLLEERFDIGRLSLISLLTMTKEEFSSVFAKTAIKRLKWRGLLRNACVAAGNLRAGPGGAPELEIDKLLPLLIDLASHEESIVRTHAVWAAYRLRPEQAAVLLPQARAREADKGVREEYAFWDQSG